MQRKHLNETVTILWLAALLGLTACGTNTEQKNDSAFFTSGNREADQRAEQRVAKNQQLEGKGSDNGKEPPHPATNSLYDRVGGEPGLQAILNDFVPRVLADPRVNWTRQGVQRGGFLGIGMQSAEWKATPANIALLQLHLQQFLAVVTGGPAKYEGREMKAAHHGLKISNVEFDASIGDLKATLDKLGVATAEQKELLALMESTRLQIVEQR